jgi:hypothetical protein
MSGDTKIGYSEDGGLFIGKNIQSDFHKNHLISIIISYEEPFEIWTSAEHYEKPRAVLIQKDVYYKLLSGSNDFLVFIHLDPYSKTGMNLTFENIPVEFLEFTLFTDVLNDFKNWLFSDGERFYQKALASGVGATFRAGEEMVHCYPLLAPMFPEATEAFDEIIRFIRSHLELE